MIKLVNVNKIYNLRKPNQFQVINQTSLFLPDQGFVALTGPSGSGKTTLLNVICGLDKVTSGTITVNETEMKKYQSQKWDNLRNRYFGYIFQNYNLFEEKTVFENVALPLELLGIKDRKLIEERVKEALAIVHMQRYIRRKANSLSGGEQQRVAIARALVKDAKIIIADEPTGNLDERNTLNIMNILKQISKSRLVLLVSHERQLARFYADRIIEIKDGEIIADFINQSQDQLVRFESHEIYLKELQKETLVDNQNVTVTQYLPTYLDGNNFNYQLNLEIIIKDGMIYLTNKSSTNPIKILNNNSEIKVIDDFQPVITRENLDVEAFDISPLALNPKGSISKSFWLYLRDGFKRAGSLRGFKRLFIMSFCLPSLLLVFGLSIWQGVSTIKDQEFVNFDKNLVSISDNRDHEQICQTFLELKEAYPGTKLSLFTHTSSQITHENFLTRYFSTYKNTTYFYASIIPYTFIENYQGLKPNPGEIVIDQLLFDALINTDQVIYPDGIYSINRNVTPSMILNQSVQINIGGNNKELKIVGISNNQNANVYLHPNDYYSNQKYLGINLTMDENEVKNSTYNLNNLADFEIIVPYPYLNSFEKSYTIGGQEIRVVGSHHGDSAMIYANSNTIEYLVLSEMVTTVTGDLDKYQIYAPDQSILQHEDKKILVESIYEIKKQEILESKSEIFKTILIITSVLTICPLIFLYFVQRSNLLVRQKEIGIYRALGMKKSGIYKISLGEIVALTIIGSLPGYLIGLYCVSQLANGGLGLIFTVNLMVIIGSLIVIFAINLLVGIIPTIRLLAKTPREILVNTDM